MSPHPREARLLRRHLEEAQARLGDRRAELALILADVQADGVSADDEHDPDGSPVSAQRSLAAAMVDAGQAEVEALQEATRRLAEGTYGRCEGCGQMIDEARLTVMPATSRCVKCAQSAARRRL